MKTYFISGHRDITPEEFNEHYVTAIDRAIKKGPCNFVVGDYYGVDKLAQTYLKNVGAEVTVYHMFESPRNNVGHPTCGGFESGEERDAAMTHTSHEDIAWIRPGKEKSGTAQNLKRRNKFKYKADFLWPHKEGSVEEMGYEFANAKTEKYCKEVWDELLVRASKLNIPEFKEICQALNSDDGEHCTRFLSDKDEHGKTSPEKLLYDYIVQHLSKEEKCLQ